MNDWMSPLLDVKLTILIIDGKKLKTKEKRRRTIHDSHHFYIHLE